MKTKLNFAVLVVFAGLMMFGIQSCQKYPDGPLIDFHSRAERVANTWKVDNYKVNGNDYTSLVTDYTETYTKGGDYSYELGGITGTGTWALQNKDAEVQITGISNQNSHTLYIQKLEEKEFWYYYMDGSDKKEFHMIPR
jgi:hypothetical protein